MGNQRKQNNEEYNIDNSNNQNKHYISIIDGKAIINGQRINVNSGFQTTFFGRVPMRNIILHRCSGRISPRRSWIKPSPFFGVGIGATVA